jgi:hypothetical protein
MAREQPRSAFVHQGYRPRFAGGSRPRPAASPWRLLPPLAGVVLSLLAYLAQNVWGLFHVQDVTAAIRGLDPAGLAFALFLIGVVEGTVVLCFYLPGTAVVILLLFGLQPSWDEGASLLLPLLAGTLAGYGLSVVLGRALRRQLPRLVGADSHARMRSAIERFGIAVLPVAAFHPNPLALAFSILGYLRAGRLWPALAVAAIVQPAWWLLYVSMASMFSRQNVVTGSNFQLFLAALFSVWLAYEALQQVRGMRLARTATARRRLPATALGR